MNPIVHFKSVKHLINGTTSREKGKKISTTDFIRRRVFQTIKHRKGEKNPGRIRRRRKRIRQSNIVFTTEHRTIIQRQGDDTMKIKKDKYIYDTACAGGLKELDKNYRKKKKKKSLSSGRSI